MVRSIKYRGADVPIRITYKAAMFDLKDLGMNILGIFEDHTAITNMLINDEVMVKVWYYFVSPHASSLENAVEDLTSELMNEFREVFWEEVLNFTNPQMRPALREFMKMIKEELASPESNLRKALSDSLEEQASTQASTPSDNSSL